MQRKAKPRRRDRKLGVRAATFILSVLLAASLPSLVHAGYHFTISASATDPFVNSATPTGTIRTLYVWLACTDEGISAFEGDLTGTLPILAFNAMNGVVNAGGSTNLLLGVPNCPVGVPVNFLLCSVVVNDTGGTVCLSASAQNNLIAAVDCTSPLPVLRPNPRVTGFSSSGGSPCEVGTNDCVGEGFIQGGSGGGSIGSEY